MNVTNGSDVLNELHVAIVETLSPVMIYLGISIVLGVPGNLLVWYYFRYKAKQSTTSVFILVLALFDLLACCVVMPIEIFYLKSYFLFDSSMACKVMRFMSQFVAKGSAFTLVIISVDRYKHVCTPLKTQMSIKGAKIASAITALLAAIFSVPTILLYDVMSIKVPNEYSVGIDGYDCITPREGGKLIYDQMRNAVDAFLIIGGAVLLIVTYSLIARVIFGSNGRYSRRQSAILDNGPKIVTQTTNQRRQKLYTLNMVVITVLYFVSFIPYLSLITWRSTLPKGKHLVELVPTVTFSLVQLGFRSWFLNAVLNPVAYGFFFLDFRMFLVHHLCRCCGRMQELPVSGTSGAERSCSNGTADIKLVNAVTHYSQGLCR